MRHNRPALTWQTDANRIVVLALDDPFDEVGAPGGVAHFCVNEWRGASIDSFDHQELFNYFSAPPLIDRGADGRAVIDWPAVTAYAGEITPAGVEPVVIHGPTPAGGWDRLSDWVLKLCIGAAGLIVVSSTEDLIPHTRPLPVSVTTSDRELGDHFGYGRPSMVGEIGAASTIAAIAENAGVRVVEVQVSVPTYVAHVPSPKAELALLKKIEDLTGSLFDLAEVAEEAEAWEVGADDLAEQLDWVDATIKQLEDEHDAMSLPEAQAEAIAEEFDRYLRRRSQNDSDG